MFDIVLNKGLPAKERKDKRGAWIKAIDRSVLLEAINACSNHLALPILSSK